MILKLNNKSKNFYSHLGKIFGSREIERKTHDRIFDDDNKEWYIYFEKGEPTVFVSVANNKIKNVWGKNEKYLLEVLKKINSETSIETSVVTVIFIELYIKAGFEIYKAVSKNFVNIRSAKHE